MANKLKDIEYSVKVRYHDYEVQEDASGSGSQINTVTKEQVI